MTDVQRLQLALSEKQGRISALLAQDTRSDDERTELQTLTGEVGELHTQLAAARAVEATAERETPTPMDSETRERIQLRGRSTLRAFLHAGVRGVALQGAEAEYMASLQLAGGIPLDLLEPVTLADAPTTAPSSGQGATLAPVSPHVFAPSIAPRMGIEMPTVGSGSYSEATITTSLTAAAKAAGGTQESTAATLTTVTASPRRIATRLTLRLEDLAQVGVDNFESALRQNLSQGLSAEYDNQAINGDGSAPNVSGLIKQLTAPTDPTDKYTSPTVLSSLYAFVDGLWATKADDIVAVVNPETYRKLGAALLTGTSDTLTELLERVFGSWTTNARMPDSKSDISTGLIYRRGQPGLRTACHPVWAMMQVEDIYTDAASGAKHVTISLLVGDKVLLVQPSAYGLVKFKLA